MRFRRKQTLMDRAHDYVEHVAETVIPQLESALEQTKEKAGPALSDARERAKPLIAEGKVKAAEGRTIAAEKAAIGAAIAAEKASVGASLAADKASVGRDLAAARLASLKAQPEPEPKGGKLKKILLLSGLLAIAGLVFKKMSGDKESANWQSSYVPTPPPPPPAPASPASPASTGATPAAAPASGPIGGDPLTDPLPAETDDSGGGAPGEAISDSAEEPHPSTTPDDPADVIDVDDVPKDR